MAQQLQTPGVVGTRRMSTPSKVRSGVLVLLGALALTAAQANTPDLTFSAYAQTYGYLNVRYSSPLLGDVSFTVNGTSDYKSNYTGQGQTTTGLASVDYTVAAGNGGSGDPLYDLITNYGQYGFNYNGQAEVAGTALRTTMKSTTVDSVTGTQVDSTTNTYQYAYSTAQWNQGFYIAPTPAKAAGSYGAIVVGITLDGAFPALADPSLYNDGWANLQASTSFTDTAGVNYQSNFAINTSASDPSWTGETTVYKKLLFQYGTVFNLNFYQYVGVGNNGQGDFFNTGRISHIELPFEAVLLSGAEQAGLGSVASLYGTVFNSATADAENTNWDFGNNGGGFTPVVPEPETWALMLAGLVGVFSLARRRV